MPRQEESGLTRINGFPPVVGKFVRVLILGSMPGNASLARNQYYGLPHNAFWSQRLRVLTDQGIALWDVLDSCYRPGSLDSAIDDRTAKANDFAMLFREHRMISYIFFNGQKAAQLFAKRILPTIEDKQPAKTLVTLPSTSPALASMTYEQKLEQWSATFQTDRLVLRNISNDE
jgi:G:T/U-mismatch repair DNA glycosylase